MARIRTVKPEFWQHEEMSGVSAEAALLAIALLNYADDEGYFNANHKLVEANCFPLRELSTNIRRLLDELSSIGYIEEFETPAGKRIGHIVTFLEHQKIDRPKKSDLRLQLEPNTAPIVEPSTNPRRTVDEPSTGEGNGMEGKRKGKGRDTSGDSAAGGGEPDPEPKPKDPKPIEEIGGVRGVWERLPESWRTPEMKAMLTVFDKHRRESNQRAWTPTGCDQKVREWTKFPIEHIIKSGYSSVEKNYQGFIVEQYRGPRPSVAPVSGSVENDAERILRERREGVKA